MKLLFAWELGGGLGHLAKAAVLAQSLRDAGCDVACCVKDPAGADALLPDDIPVFQAPLAAPLRDWPDPADLAEVLLHAGLGDEAGLAGRVRAWTSLLDLVRPQVLLADHAPTAVLAARCAGVPAVLFGNGFVLPPRPWPEFRATSPVTAARPQRVRQQVRHHLLRVVNAVLDRWGQPALGDIEDLYATQPQALAASPDLDHFPRQPLSAPHLQLGPLFLDAVGEPPAWPAHPGPRVFAYLRASLPQLDQVVASLAALDAAVLVRCDGLDAARVQAMHAPNLVITPAWVRMADVAQQAQLVVCSGSDTAFGLAAHGVPVLGLPLNAEQRLAIERLQALGVGRMWLPGPDRLDQLAGHLHELLHSSVVHAAAVALRARHSGLDSRAALEGLARELMQRYGTGAA